MNEKNRLVLHFGMPKTGTTSLQRFLAENRKQLENYGWTYPDFRYPGGGGNTKSGRVSLPT